MTTDKVPSGLDIIDLLLRNTYENNGCHSNQSWTITIHKTPSPEESVADDILDTLLGDSDSSSAPASPLWSPCTTDSGINEDPLTDSTGSPHPSYCNTFQTLDTPTYSQPAHLGNYLPKSGKTADVSINQCWESSDLQQHGMAFDLTTNQSCSLLSSQTLTVKDLLLSNLGQKVKQIPQPSLPELELNEDEKTLLAKEGVNLPSKLPLSKFEEKVLKKIRRKIRNKRSAQESRRKRREYVDSLEGRMSACSAHNLELQRKIQHLEQTNNSLLEQLNRLQALLLSNSSSKTKHKGTCILVLLLSLSLLISSNLQPEPYSQLSQGENMEAKVPSRSLLIMDEVQDVPPPASPFLSVSRGYEAFRSFTEKLWAWTDVHMVNIQASRHQDFRHRDDH